MSAIMKSARFLTDATYDRHAGVKRIADHITAVQSKADRINAALTVLRTDCTSEEDAVRALHAVSAGLMTTNPLPSTDERETVELLDELADRIQYRHAI